MQIILSKMFFTRPTIKLIKVILPVKKMSTSPVIIPATEKHTATLIFLHGLGDTGHGWASAIGEIRQPFIKVICPTANTIPVTLNAGFRMPSWFDLLTLDSSGPEDTDGIKNACKLIHTMVENEVKAGIAPNRIVLGGFSQGGALALYSALTYPQKLAGVVCLSCWLPLHKTFPDSLRAPSDLPVLQCHGDFDAVVPYKWGQMTASLLKVFLNTTEFKTYKGLSHSSSDAEFQDVKKFIEKVLPAQ